jgi:hypothetical protein
VPPLPLSLPAAAAATGALATNATTAALQQKQQHGSYATLASRMRAMGWKVDLLTNFERQLLPPATKATTATTTVLVLGAPTRRFSRGELDALRRFLVERGGRLWLLAEGSDPAGDSLTTTTTTNLWRRLTGPLMGIAPRAREAVVRLAPWPAAPPLLARAAAAALEVAVAAEEEEDDGEEEQQEASVRRAVASLRRVRRAAATSGLCLHPRHALVSGGGGGGGGAGTTTTTTTTTILNRSVARAFLDPPDADEAHKDEPDPSFVFANGCPLDVFVEKATAATTTSAPAPLATPLLSSGRLCYPTDRPLMAAWEPQGAGGGGRALVVGSAAMFSDAWIGSSNGSGDNAPPAQNRCEGNRRLADWCLRWLGATAGEQLLDASDGAAARAAMGVVRAGGKAGKTGPSSSSSSSSSRYRRPPHALLPAVGALASRAGAAAVDGGGTSMPAVSLPPAAALRGDWRAMLDQAAFDEREDGGETTTADAAAAALLLRPLS